MIVVPKVNRFFALHSYSVIDGRSVNVALLPPWSISDQKTSEEEKTISVGWRRHGLRGPLNVRMHIGVVAGTYVPVYGVTVRSRACLIGVCIVVGAKTLDSKTAAIDFESRAYMHS